MDRRRFLNICAISVPAIIVTRALRAEDDATGASNGAAMERWNKLTPEQQKLVQERWAQFKQMTPERRARLVEAQKRYQQLSPDRQKQLREGLMRWKKMSAQNRDKLRQMHTRFRKFTPEKQQIIRERLQRWQRMTPAQRDGLRRRFQRQGN